MGPRWTITVGEAAERLEISRTSAYKCATAGEIPTVRLEGRVLVPHGQLLAMLDGDPPRHGGENAGVDDG